VAAPSLFPNAHGIVIRVVGFHNQGCDVAAAKADGRLMNFANSMDAKTFLVSRIVQEAKRRQILLSDLEQKMLYFSETYASLPDMLEINERFESEYDDEEYEKKIAKLSSSAYRRDSKESPEIARQWREAIKVLKKEDHYILVLIDVPLTARDVLKLIVAAVVVVALGLSVYAGVDWLRHHVHTRVLDSVQLMVFILVVAAFGLLSWNDKAGKRIGDWLDRLIKLIIRW
jgi:hypothetical protein